MTFTQDLLEWIRRQVEQRRFVLPGLKFLGSRHASRAYANQGRFCTVVSVLLRVTIDHSLWTDLRP